MAICRIVSKFAPKIERNQMNKLIKTVCALFTAVLLLASCMKSDDDSPKVRSIAIQPSLLSIWETLNKYTSYHFLYRGDRFYQRPL